MHSGSAMGDARQMAPLITVPLCPSPHLTPTRGCCSGSRPQSLVHSVDVAGLSARVRVPSVPSS